MWIIISGCSLGSFGLTTSQLFHMACEQALHFESRASSGSRSFLHFRLACVAQKVLCLSSFHTNISWQWKKNKKKTKKKQSAYLQKTRILVSQSNEGRNQRHRFSNPTTQTTNKKNNNQNSKFPRLLKKKSKNRPINSFFIGHFKAVIL